MNNHSGTTKGMTAVEAMIILAVLTSLATVTMVGLVSSVRRARLAQAIDQVEQAHSDASIFARTRVGAMASGYYGVRINGATEPNTVEVTYGSLGAGSPLVLRSSKINENMQFYQEENPVGAYSWYYLYESGYPLNPSTLYPKPIGVYSGERLSLRSLDNSLKRAFSIYEVGIFYAERLD